MKALRTVVLIALSTALCNVHALQLYTEEYPPISFSSVDRPSGLGPDIVRSLLQRLNIDAAIQVVPWSRAYHSALNSADTAALVTMRTPEREALFKWVGPIMVATDSFYALKDSNLHIHRVEDLAHISKIALPRDWYTYQELQDQGMQNLLAVTDPAQMFDLLQQGRVPLILADNLSFYAQGEASNLVSRLRHEDVKVVLPYRQTYGYISFWKGTTDEEIQRWQTALDQMKQDGSFSRIYQRWLPGELEPGLREFSATP